MGVSYVGCFHLPKQTVVESRLKTFLNQYPFQYEDRHAFFQFDEEGTLWDSSEAVGEELVNWHQFIQEVNDLNCYPKGLITQKQNLKFGTRNLSKLFLLATTLEDARIALSKSPDYELILSHRWRILSQFGPVLKTENWVTQYGIGLHRRTVLAMLCVQHVLNIWEKSWPNNKGPHLMLLTAEEYLRGILNEKTVDERKNQFWEKLQDLNYYSNNNLALHVGDAALNVITIAMVDQYFEQIDNINELRFDTDYDSEEWDTHFYASIVYAEGAPWEESSNPERRKEFWEWYLNEAVPKAWDTPYPIQEGTAHALISSV